MQIRVHRVYHLATAPDGEWFLVDRLWPRGVRKENLSRAQWLKDAAPTNELRHWYGHDPEKWEEFQKRYSAELDARPEAWGLLLEAARKGPIVLLYSSKEMEFNNAVALKAYLQAKAKAL